MSEMEEDVKRFFTRIVWSVTLILTWVFLTVGIGIYKKWLIPEGKWGWDNLVFYIISLAALIFVLKKLKGYWSEKFPHG